MEILIGLFAIIAGAVMAFRPSFWWEMTEAWKTDDFLAEPSKTYLRRARLGGILALIAGVVGTVLMLLPE